MIFPVPFKPDYDWRGGRGFGADRSAVAALLKIPGGKLRHGACDLIVPNGTPVLAMEDGIVIRSGYAFFLGTWAIEVQHSQFIARYCEITSNVNVRVGQRVVEGQVIATVGNQPGADMLHLELFSGHATGNLSTDKNNPRNAPYYRRSDLMDPTPVLDGLVNTISGRKAPYYYHTDEEGRKFLRDRQVKDIVGKITIEKMPSVKSLPATSPTVISPGPAINLPSPRR